MSKIRTHVLTMLLVLGVLLFALPQKAEAWWVVDAYSFIKQGQPTGQGSGDGSYSSSSVSAWGSAWADNWEDPEDSQSSGGKDCTLTITFRWQPEAGYYNNPGSTLCAKMDTSGCEAQSFGGVYDGEDSGGANSSAYIEGSLVGFQSTYMGSSGSVDVGSYGRASTTAWPSSGEREWPPFWDITYEDLQERSDAYVAEIHGNWDGGSVGGTKTIPNGVNFCWLTITAHASASAGVDYGEYYATACASAHAEVQVDYDWWFNISY